MMMTENIKYDVLVEALCPCGQAMSVVRDAAGEAALLHEEPPCEAFLRDRPPDQYLAEVRAFAARRGTA